MKDKTILFKRTPHKKNKVASDELTISRKEFRETPVVEKFYKTINEFKFRKAAYKVAIQLFLNIKK